MTLADALPQIAVGAGYGYSHFQTNILKNGLNSNAKGNGAVFVTMRVPLTAWWETAHKLKEQQYAIEQAQLDANYLGAQLDLRSQQAADQLLPKVVNDSVISFLRDIVISILVVIVVMLMLFPLRTALVASTGVPVCTAICIGLMFLTGIELNTVTLAALIFVLGMIVDDSVIVIDGYSRSSYGLFSGCS